MGGVFKAFAAWFVRLACREAREAYKRKKARERAEKDRLNAAIARANARAIANAERADRLAKVKAANAAACKIKQADHVAEMDRIARQNRPGPNPYE